VIDNIFIEFSLYLSQRDVINKAYKPQDLELLTKADNFLDIRTSKGTSFEILKMQLCVA